jgi:hypothetical protein
MVKQQTYPPEKAVPILEKSIEEGEKLRKETYYDAPEREVWENKCEGAMTASLGDGHPTVIAFGAAQSSFSSIYDPPHVRLK